MVLIQSKIGAPDGIKTLDQENGAKTASTDLVGNVCLGFGYAQLFKHQNELLVADALPLQL